MDKAVLYEIIVPTEIFNCEIYEVVIKLSQFRIGLEHYEEENTFGYKIKKHTDGLLLFDSKSGVRFICICSQLFGIKICNTFIKKKKQVK